MSNIVGSINYTGPLTINGTAYAPSPWTSSGSAIYYNTGRIGVGTATPGYNLHVIGDIYASGDVTALSDQRFKQNIQPLDGALAKILRLTGYSYTRDDYRVGEKQIGLLAQEVQGVYPEAVLYDEAADKYSLNYSVMVAPLIQSMKEMHSLLKYQSTTIALLSKRVDDMETFIATMM